MIIQKQNRELLGEGRNFGMGYSFLKKNKDEKNYDTVLAFTACKDYLNDVIYVERGPKHTLNKVHGFKHEYEKLFEKEENFFYFGLCPLNRNGIAKDEKGWLLYDRYVKFMEENIIYLMLAVNEMERIFNFSSPTILVQKDQVLIKGELVPAYVLKVPIEWSKSPYHISFYGVFLRYYLGLKDLKDLKKYNPFIPDDAYHLGNITYILENGLEVLEYPSELYNKTSNKHTIHNDGYVSAISKDKLFKKNNTDKQKTIDLCWQ